MSLWQILALQALGNLVRKQKELTGLVTKIWNSNPASKWAYFTMGSECLSRMSYHLCHIRWVLLRFGYLANPKVPTEFTTNQPNCDIPEPHQIEKCFKSLRYTGQT